MSFIFSYIGRPSNFTNYLAKLINIGQNGNSTPQNVLFFIINLRNFCLKREKSVTLQKYVHLHEPLFV